MDQLEATTTLAQGERPSDVIVDFVSLRSSSLKS
jgi:hypothetical protein